MSALGHFLEDEGLATTGVSLIRMHAEKIKPPRSVWVPFELGRPLGAPNNPLLQRQVLERVLSLLESDDGPTVLVDFEYDGDVAERDSTWRAPWETYQPIDLADGAAALNALQSEISALEPLYAGAVADKGRTTVGTSKLDMSTVAAHIVSFLGGPHENSPREDLSAAMTLRFGADDLKAYYMEAAAHGGHPSSWQLGEWFWRHTVAAQIFVDLRRQGLETEDRRFKIVGSSGLVPRDWVEALGL